MKFFAIFAALVVYIITVASLATPPPPSGEAIPAADVTIVKTDEVVNITSRGPSFAHGRCCYHVKVHQYCYKGGCRWQSWSATQDPTRDCGDCRVGAWTTGPLECRIDWKRDRYQDMDCSFNC